MSNPRMELWFDFCDRHGVATGEPLFQTTDGVVNIVRRGPGGRPALERSARMERMVMREVTRVIGDFHSGEDRLEGLIYCMYTPIEGRPHPLYIGKAGKFGKGEHNLSANLKGIKTTTQHPFARWGYNYAYHFGDLSAAVLAEHHPEDKRKPKYLRWADALFERPWSECHLKRPVHLWMGAWGRDHIGPWSQFGPTRLDFLEYLLIGTVSDAFPDLLNQEGVGLRGAR